MSRDDLSVEWLARRDRMFAPELVACLAENRAPTDREVCLMAQRIGQHLNGYAHGQTDQPALKTQQERLVRAAHVALCGDDGVSLGTNDPRLDTLGRRRFR